MAECPIAAFVAFSCIGSSSIRRPFKSNIRDLARPGCLELIKHIRENTAKKLALATSTTRRGVDLILGAQGLDILHCFDCIICGDEVSKSKPDPQIYLKTAGHFPDLRNFLAFEDSHAGVLSAKRAAINCIAVPNKYTLGQDFAEADRVISDLTPSAAIL